MKTSLPAPSKSDQRRFMALHQIGCIACRKLNMHMPIDVHHILSGGRRVSHQHTIGLCPWHHRGVLYRGEGEGEAWQKLLAGPSLAHGSKPFVEKFGTEEELLAETNEILAANNMGDYEAVKEKLESKSGSTE